MAKVTICQYSIANFWLFKAYFQRKMPISRQKFALSNRAKQKQLPLFDSKIKYPLFPKGFSPHRETY